VIKKQIYQNIKESLERRLEQNEADAEDALREILKFAEYYRRFRYPREEPEPHLQRWFDRFRRLDFTTSYPFLLNLYNNYHTERTLSLEEFEDMILLVESYFVRRLFVGRPTNVLNKTFNTLYRDIDLARPVESLRENLLGYTGNQVWPNDEQFREGIGTLIIYTPSSRADRVKLILESLNAALTKEQVKEDLTVEHIMPQTLTDEWRAVLGPEAEEQHLLWSGTLGNLTVTAYNSELSNKPFNEKLHLLRESNISLNNRYFRNVEVWDIEAIKQRSDYLGDLAIKVWPR